MGHKVAPIAFRLPYIISWKSTWYADKKSYTDNLSVDNKLRTMILKELRGIPLGDINISKTSDSIIVDIFTSKAALVLGKEGEKLKDMTAVISKKVKEPFKINVKEIKNPDLNAKIVGFNVASQIEKRQPYKRAVKMAVARAMEKGAKGIKIKVSGRLNGVEIARNETFKDGNIPTQTIRADIDYVSCRSETIYGTIGVKVWIYKGDIFKKK